MCDCVFHSSRLIEAVKSSEAPPNEEPAATAEEGMQKEDSKTVVEDCKEPLVAEVEREERIPSGFVIVERYSWRGEQQHSDTLLRLSSRGSVGGELVLPPGLVR